MRVLVEHVMHTAKTVIEADWLAQLVAARYESYKGDDGEVVLTILDNDESPTFARAYRLIKTGERIPDGCEYVRPVDGHPALHILTCPV